MSEITTSEALPLPMPVPPPPVATGEPLPRPRIRAGAALWGLTLIAIGGWALWTASDRYRRADAIDAVLTMTPLAWTVTVVIALGATITLISLAAVIRRLQFRAPGR